MQAAVDVHQATVVAGGDDLGVSAEDSVELLIEHGAGDVGILDGEGAAEAAALLEAWKRDEIDVADGAKKRRRTIAELERAQTVAAGVIGDPMWEDRVEVGDAEAFCEKLGELVDTRKKRFNLRDEPGVFASGFELAGHCGVVLAHVSDAA